MSGKPFKVACVQNCAGTETEPNLKDCADLVREAAAGARTSSCCRNTSPGSTSRATS